MYHQFKDNCSTRIRDLLDIGTGGQFRTYFDKQPGRFTLREHMRRFSWYSPFYDWFLGFLLGRDVDREISVWEEMYLPIEMGRNITGFGYVDSSGGLRGLVSGVETVNQTKNRTAILDAPRPQWPRTLAPGLGIAALAALIIPFRKKHPLAGRALWGVSQSLLGLAAGGLGTILFFVSRAVERDYMRHNINLLFVNPLLLAAIPLGLCAAAGTSISTGAKPGLAAEQCLRCIWLYVFAAGSITGLSGLIPPLYQRNQPTLALILPVTLVFLLPGVRGLCRRLRQPCLVKEISKKRS